MSFVKINKILKTLHKNLSTKYSLSIEEYCKSKITSLIFHKRSHYTTIFIEYLISDDIQEFLNDYYTKNNLLTYLFYLISNNKKCKFIPIIINEFGRKLILDNKHIKSLIFQYRSKMNQLKGFKQNLFNSNYSHFTYILPIDISSTITKKNCSDITEKTIQNDDDNYQKNMRKNNGNKCVIHNESESTINNLNVNDDISYSIDLTLNKKYDDKVLRKNIEFIKGKNNKNDEELVKLLNKLKPLDTSLIYDKKKRRIKNYNYYNYMNSLKKKINNKKLENDLKYVTNNFQNLKIKNSRNNSSNKNTNTNSFNLNSISYINLGDVKKKNYSSPKHSKNDNFKNKNSKKIYIEIKTYNKNIKSIYTDNSRNDLNTFYNNSKNNNNSINAVKQITNKKINTYESNSNKNNVIINIPKKNSINKQIYGNNSIKIKKKIFNSEFNISNINSNNVPKIPLLFKKDNMTPKSPFKIISCKKLLKIKSLNDIAGALNEKPYICKDKMKNEDRNKKINIKNPSNSSKKIKINNNTARNHNSKSRYILPLFKDRNNYLDLNVFNKNNNIIKIRNNFHRRSMEKQHGNTNKKVLVIDKTSVNIKEQKINPFISVK